ncbi:NAD(P)H-dependent oxidoreductase [Enterovibrio nigricans]|uniref:Putative NADPH-quinone reductase (Modulator of drug activity B) n=1 Tax=Enterovibrio nigricans DSM 22720 TaxID=1121868 RepID=A0A1T4UQA7_9GAMM|nr:NAD(P)H-dependent oxidoreductase [Enterovibrio nigricans]PKF51064.1 flavodoxin family protein [Enterovibrio nigricans]SKA54853.1 Putative NADPH-quinone reductase (modulator of drug activity B) [Enterovibrio nigricans DSM 22720]
MKCLLVLSHPLENSLCHYLCTETVDHLIAKGHEVEVLDLYRHQFDPVLTQSERQTYYAPEFDKKNVETEIQQLKEAELLVLVFPTWWFGFPAILKGWFDRVWAPGHAYDHASDLGAIKPRLEKLKEVKVITTMGSPWWVDTFVLWQPVKRILRIALLGACAKQCRFSMFTLYRSENVSKARVDAFLGKIKRRI